jgi:hypothetical protein
MLVCCVGNNEMVNILIGSSDLMSDDRWPTATDIKNDLAFHIWSCSSNVRSCPGKLSAVLGRFFVINSNGLILGCKIAIEKNGGCLHMTCTRCRTEFFWYVLLKIIKQ